MHCSIGSGVDEIKKSRPQAALLKASEIYSAREAANFSTVLTKVLYRSGEMSTEET